MNTNFFFNFPKQKDIEETHCLTFEDDQFDADLQDKYFNESDKSINC